MKSLQKIGWVISLMSLLFVLPGCKEKGCTDKAALNYSSIADEDDGSCSYCKLENSSIGFAEVTLFDGNSSSPHFGDEVASFTFDQQSLHYNDQRCGKSNRCVINVTVTNLVDETMDLPYTVSGFNNVFFTISGNITLTPHQSSQIEVLDSTNVSNPCGFISSSNVFANTNGIIKYH